MSVVALYVAYDGRCWISVEMRRWRSFGESCCGGRM